VQQSFFFTPSPAVTHSPEVGQDSRSAVKGLASLSLVGTGLEPDQTPFVSLIAMPTA
jgi:hypothetical protein